nr:PREDICTED: T-cell receptor alpha chain V region 2B4 [Anolis carolinensis]|eukprot:XP_016849906.1 PREDICTED: T-cell receptor alpha chain V region 2B4 [Anolis carolinensis]
MAAVAIQSCRGTCEFHPFLSLIVLWSLVGKVSAMTVIQEPPFASFSQGKELTFNCSHSESGSYHFFWYRQQPGKIELQVLGNLYFFDNKLTEIDTSLESKLTGNWLDGNKKKMSLHFKDLQPGDVGLYLCAVRDTVRKAGTGADAELSARNSSRAVEKTHPQLPKSALEPFTLTCKVL